jgi:hypothetical protein
LVKRYLKHIGRKSVKPKKVKKLVVNMIIALYQCYISLLTRSMDLLHKQLHFLNFAEEPYLKELAVGKKQILNSFELWTHYFSIVTLVKPNGTSTQKRLNA